MPAMSLRVGSTISSPTAKVAGHSKRHGPAVAVASRAAMSPIRASKARMPSGGLGAFAGQALPLGLSRLALPRRLEKPVSPMAQAYAAGASGVPRKSSKAATGPKISEDTFARAAIFLAPMLWATGAPLGRLLLTQPLAPGPAVITCTKFLIAAVCFTPVLYMFFADIVAKQKRRIKRMGMPQAEMGLGSSARLFLAGMAPHWPLMKFAAEQAIYLCLGNVLATLSLAFSTASKADFVTNSGKILLVPLLSLLCGKRVNTSTWHGMFAALTGIVLIFFDGGLGVRDLFLVAASLCFSLHTSRVSGTNIKFDPAVFTGLEMAFVAAFSLAGLCAHAAMSPEGFVLHMAAGLAPLANPHVQAIMMFMGVGTTSLAMLCQTYGQSRVPAAEAQVVYSSQPVWASVYSIMLLGEGLGRRGMLGALIVIASSIRTGLEGAGEDSKKFSSKN